MAFGSDSGVLSPADASDRAPLSCTSVPGQGGSLTFQFSMSGVRFGLWCTLTSGRERSSPPVLHVSAWAGGLAYVPVLHEWRSVRTLVYSHQRTRAIEPPCPARQCLGRGARSYVPVLHEWRSVWTWCTLTSGREQARQCLGRGLAYVQFSMSGVRFGLWCTATGGRERAPLPCTSVPGQGARLVPVLHEWRSVPVVYSHRRTRASPPVLHVSAWAMGGLRSSSP